MTDLCFPPNNSQANFFLLERWLESQIPRSLPLYRLTQKYILGDEHHAGREVKNMFVDDIKDPRVLLRAEKDHDTTAFLIYMSVFTPKSFSLLSVLLQRVISSAKREINDKHLPVRFIALQRECYDVVVEVMRQNNFFQPRLGESCRLWSQDKIQDAQPRPSSFTLPEFGRFVMRPLTKQDAERVNDHWKYKSSSSIVKVRHIIDKYPSCGLFLFGRFVDEPYEDKGQLITWAVSNSDGSIGMLHTIDRVESIVGSSQTATSSTSFRRRGFAKKVLQKLMEYRTSRSLSLPIFPIAFDYIVEGNGDSEQLFHKLGFSPKAEVDWLRFEQKTAVVSSKVTLSQKWEDYFDREGLPPWDNGHHSTVLEGLLTLTDGGLPDEVKTGSSIDIGTGTGRNALLLNKSGFRRVVGLDIAKSALNRARNIAYEHYNDWGEEGSIEFREGDIFHMATPSTPLAQEFTGQFDFLFDLQVFHALRFQGETVLVDAMATLLKPNGYAMVIAGYTDEFKGEYARVGPPTVSKREMIEAFSPRFDIILMRKAVFDPNPNYTNFPCHVLFMRKR